MANKRPEAVKSWEELKKGGGIAHDINTLEALLTEDTAGMLSRDEVLGRVMAYFRSCTHEVINEDGDTITTWIKNPTKADLASFLGIDKQTLVGYVAGIDSRGRPYGADHPEQGRRISTADFPILRRAYAIIEAFYEGQLALNKNNAGSIFWLNNSLNTRWSNEQEIIVRGESQNTMNVMEARNEYKKFLSNEEIKVIEQNETEDILLPFDVSIKEGEDEVQRL